MIEVMIRNNPWRRSKPGTWEVFEDDIWQAVTDAKEISALETGFKYGRDYLRWQISQLTAMS